MSDVNIKLTKSQEAVLKKIKDFVYHSEGGVFILKGYAGTGKTTLLKFIVEELQNRKLAFSLMAPTGRAAKVIRDKTGCGASTIHSAIYDSCDLVEHKECDGDYKLIFPLKFDDGERMVNIVDESSMISAVYSKHEIFQFGTGVLLDDLLTFASPLRGGKLIFIGDPAQLPPVTDSKSLALDENYFRAKGIETQVAELTQVIRQSDSAILRNATKVRELIATNCCSNLNFEQRKDDVESVQSITDTYCALYDVNGSRNPIVITYSNENARRYNNEIRANIYPSAEHVVPQDVLQCVNNNRLYGVLNGEFVRVIDVGESVETHRAPVWVEEGGKSKSISVSVTFRDVVIQNDEGCIFPCKIIDSLLLNGERSLTVPEMRALYVDFKMRHPRFRPGSKEFNDAMLSDPYLNAMQVKYGYAITCHKAQGGEWDAVFVDFQNRHDISLSTLRWIYTAITRAKNCLYSADFPKTTSFEKLRFMPINKVRHRPDAFDASVEVLDENDSPNSSVSPFHDENAEQFLKDKYVDVVDALAMIGCSVEKVLSFPYLEKYTILTPSGRFVYDGYYKKNHVFTFRPNQQCVDNEKILALLNVTSKVTPNEMDVSYEVSYEPSTDSFRELYIKMIGLLEQYGSRLVNVVEYPESYYVRYCLKTSGAFSYVDFFVDGKGFLTNARPSSDLGNADVKLQSILNDLQNNKI